MNLGASMLAKRVQQPENRPGRLGLGILIGLPVSIAMWVALIWLMSVVMG